MYDVCLVSLLHPSMNPRLAKELRCLINNGYRVHVVACKFARWADDADAEFSSLQCDWTWVRFAACANPLLRHARRVQHFAARKFAQCVLSFQQRVPRACVIRALNPGIAGVMRATSKIRARLYIAHCVPALPAACCAALKFQGKVGFDAEDFHRGQFEAKAVKSVEQLSVEYIEDSFIPKCHFVTAGSDGIGREYSRLYGIDSIQTILNVFPLHDRELVLPSAEVEGEKRREECSLYWFSQTIGGSRGLENVVKALCYLPDNVVLSVRGSWQLGYRESFDVLTKKLGVWSRIRVLSPAPPGEMVARAACHDVGLAVEPGSTVNNCIAVSNKLLTYLAAGIPCIATDTPGQRGIAQHISNAVVLVPSENPSQMAVAVRSLIDRRVVACKAAMEYRKIYCWERESQKFLQTYRSVLLGRNASKSVDLRRE